MAKHHIEATVNGDAVEFLCETEDTLLDVLRDTLNMTGSKEGCASGDCGACSVTLDGRLVCSCLVLGCEVSGRRIETIEGMAKGEALHPLHQKFLEKDIDLATFVQKYKKLRTAYHKQALLHLAGQTSLR